MVRRHPALTVRQAIRGDRVTVLRRMGRARRPPSSDAVAVWLFGGGALLSGAFVAKLSSSTYARNPTELSLGGVAASVLLALALAIASATVLRVRQSQLLSVFLLAFVVRALTVLLVSPVFQFDDELHHHATAAALSTGGSLGWDYQGLVARLYRLLGTNPLLPKMFNAWLGALTCVRVVQLFLFARRHEPRTLKLMALGVALAPPIVLYSATNLKEPVAAFLLVEVAVAVTRRDRHLAISAGHAILATGALWAIRGSGWAIVAVALTGVGLALRASMPGARRLSVRSWIARGTAVVLLLGGFNLLAGDIQKRYIEGRVGVEYFRERYETVAASKNLDVDPVDALAPTSLARAAAASWFVPSPLRVLRDRSLPVLLEATVSATWYLMVPALLFAVFRPSRADIRMAAILGFVVAFVAMAGLGIGTDDIRHRVVAYPLLVAASIGAYRSMEASQRTRLIAAWALVALSVNGYLLVQMWR